MRPSRPRTLTALLLLALAPELAAAASAQPVRVAVLLPFVGDALRTVPDHADVVASVRRQLAQAPGGDVVDLGNPHAPNLESLAQARPELVVGDRMLHAALAPDLSRAGGEVLLLDTTSLDATFASLVDLGRRIDAEAELRAASERARAEIEALALEEPLPVLALFGAPGSFLVITDRTWMGDLLTRLNFALLGASHTGSERFPGFVDVSNEQLVTLRPKLVLMVAHGDPRAIEARFRERLDTGVWRGLRDAAVLGVHALDPALFAANPGLGLPDAARALAALAGARGR